MTCKIWVAYSLWACYRPNSTETPRKLDRWTPSSRLNIWGQFIRLKLRMRLGKIRYGMKVLTFLYNQWVTFWKLLYLMKTTSLTILWDQISLRLDNFAETRGSMSGYNLTMRITEPQNYWLKLYMSLLERLGIKIIILFLKVR
jgi:hypothetical protein